MSIKRNIVFFKECLGCLPKIKCSYFEIVCVWVSFHCSLHHIYPLNDIISSKSSRAPSSPTPNIKKTSHQLILVLPTLTSLVKERKKSTLEVSFSSRDSRSCTSMTMKTPTYLVSKIQTRFSHLRAIASTQWTVDIFPGVPYLYLLAKSLNLRDRSDLSKPALLLMHTHARNHRLKRPRTGTNLHQKRPSHLSRDHQRWPSHPESMQPLPENNFHIWRIISISPITWEYL